VTVWRVCSRRHARRAFSGDGARLYGGRWNSAGKLIVYTSATLSLASLEVLVHVAEEEWPDDLCAMPAAIPANIKVQELKQEQLPRGWRRFPAPINLRKFGDTWVEAGETAVLAVPSAVIPIEKNYLLNPSHSDMKNVEIGAPQRFDFDLRLKKPRRA
jgi:RES domain-containing protein